MRYERPAIVRREPIAAFLDTVTSEGQQQPDGVTPSDVRVKEHIQPVAWSDEPVAYTRPGIADRAALDGLLLTVRSEGQQPDSGDTGDGNTVSDVRVKEHIRPIAWGDEPVAYTRPGIAAREALAGLLGTVTSEADQADN